MGSLMKVVVVTGSNKGIGRGIVETLCKLLPRDQWTVYLTARNAELGAKTIQELESAIGFRAQFHQLDIDCEQSRAALKAYLVDKYGGLDVLINNAGIAYKRDSTAPFAEQAEVTLRTNFFDTLRMCQEFLPILRKDGRLVNVSSMMSLRTLKILGKELYNQFLGPMSMSELETYMHDFIKCAADGILEQHGWASQAYGVSKIGVTKMTQILAEENRGDPRNILINCCCPGYVDTDMSSHKGHLTIYEGADTPIYLATLPVTPEGPRGLFFCKRQEVKWE